MSSYPVSLCSVYQPAFKSALSEHREELRGDSEKRFRQQTRTHADTAQALVTHRKLGRLKQGSSRGDTRQSDDLMGDTAVQIPVLILLF